LCFVLFHARQDFGFGKFINIASTRPVEPGWMTQGLEAIFGDLGLTQYLDAFIDQGFDVWDTILDIQESDL
jgi:hypothetical protein